MVVFSQKQQSITTCSHPVTWCFCSPLQSLIIMICLCTTQTKHTIQTHHSHSVSSVPFSLHHHLSVIQSYNCFMLKHPWQYPTHCIFAPSNLLTNNYTHYPRVLTLNSTHIARNLQLIIYQTEPVKGFWQCHIQNGCHCIIY